MPIRAILTSLLIILIPYTGAYADSTIEIRPKKGFLILESFRQSLGMTYQYSGHNVNDKNADYMTNRFEEVYHVQTSGAIVDRHLLNFQLNGDFRLQQVDSSSDLNGSSSSSGSKFQYNLGASAFERRWYPTSIHSSRVISTVANPFLPSYEFDSSNNGIIISLQKGPVPVQLRYERNSSHLSNSKTDVTTTSDAFFVSGSHNYRDISASSVGGSLSRAVSDSQGFEQATEHYSLKLGNSLYWGRVKNYSLISQFDWQKTDTASVPQQNATLNETLLGHLGKALDADLAYRYLSSKTTSLAGEKQTYASNSLAASLSHRLFASLDTRLRGSVMHSDLQGGAQDSYSASGSVTYKKKIPAYSYLTVVLQGEHSETDRHGDVARITTRDETHKVVQPGENITLGSSGPLKTGSVTIRGYTTPPPNPQFPTDIIFTEEVDYTVDHLLGRIIWGALVPSVPDIKVTYETIIDPAVNFATDTASLSGNLSLLSGRYVVSGSIYKQDQRLISGQSQNNLYDTTIMRLRFERHGDEVLYGLDLEDYDSGPTKYRFLEGWWLYTHNTPVWALTLQARDRYTQYVDSGFSEGYWQNIFSSSATISRGLNSWSQLSLSTNFIDTRREDGHKDSTDAVSVKANLRFWFNKLTGNLLGQSSLRFFGKTTVRDDYVRMDITRYF